MSMLEVMRASRPEILWPLDEGLVVKARDLSGHDRNGTYVNVSTPYLQRAGGSIGSWAAPRFSHAAYVEGGLTVGSSCSFECWMSKFSHLAGYPGDINSVIGNLFNTSNGVLLRYDGASSLKVYYATGGGFATITAPWNPAPGRPVHIGFSLVSSGRARLVMNGTTVVDQAASSVSGFNGTFRVGSSEDGRYIDAAISWVAAYNREVLPSEFRSHYQTMIAPYNRSVS